MASSAEHLLAALLEHQQQNSLHADVKIVVGDDGAHITIDKDGAQPLALDVPPLLGHALAELLLKKLGLPRGAAGTSQEGFFDDMTAEVRHVALARITFTETGEIVTLSYIDPDLGDPDTLFTEQQRKQVVNALDTRSGLVGVSGPTLGSTITVLHALEELLKEYAAAHQVHVAASLGAEPLDALQNTLHRLPAFVLTTLSDAATEDSATWNAITQAATAGSVVIVGMPGRDTPSLVRTLHEHTPSFLWNPLFQLTIVHAPFPTACPSCAIPMPVHPDVVERFARDTDPAFLRELKSAHAPGCLACNFHGTGPTLGAVELCTPDLLPDDLSVADLASALRTRGMRTMVDDLVQRAYTTPVPLTKVLGLLG